MHEIDSRFVASKKAAQMKPKPAKLSAILKLQKVENQT